MLLVTPFLESESELFINWLFSLRLTEPLNYFETHYWRFRQTYFFENNQLLAVYRANKLKESRGC